MKLLDLRSKGIHLFISHRDTSFIFGCLERVSLLSEWLIVWGLLVDIFVRNIDFQTYQYGVIKTNARYGVTISKVEF